MMREGGEVLRYRFSKPEDASYYVLKRSDLDYYFKVAEYMVDPVTETTREKLVQARTGDVSSEPAGDKRNENDDDASAAVVAGVILGWIIGFILGALGASLQTVQLVTAPIGFGIGLAISIVPIKLILGKDFGEFRLVLLQNENGV